MTYSDIHIVCDTTLSIAQNHKTGKSQSPSRSGVDAHSVHLNTFLFKGRWGSRRSDTRPLVRRSSQFNDSRDYIPSLHASGIPHSAKRYEKVTLFPSRATTYPELSEQPRKSSDSYRPMGASTLNGSLDGHGHRSPTARGTTKARAHMKPLLRKMSRDDTSPTSIDLSRPSFDQEGLGIYTEREGRSSDPFANYAFRRPVPGAHNRSTSGTSQFSATSSSSKSKPGSQYIHPMRQAPRSYTPPLGQSYQTSIMESDDSGNGDSAEGEIQAQSSSDTFQPFVRTSSGQTPRLSLQIHDGSFTRLAGASQTNVTGRSSFGYSRENGSNIDPVSPMSRSSLDFVFRSKTRTSMDPISRAATVQAARQAFEEKEAAKTQKLEKQQIKAEEKQMRRQEKNHQWRTSLKDEEETPRPAPEKELSEKSHSPQVPKQASPTPQAPEPKSGSWKSQSKNTWMLFVTWLRTRIFKLRRKFGNLG